MIEFLVVVVVRQWRRRWRLGVTVLIDVVRVAEDNAARLDQMVEVVVFVFYVVSVAGVGL